MRRMGKPKPNSTRSVGPGREGAGPETELGFTPQEVESFWSRVAEEHYLRANLQLHGTHVQRFDISVPRLGIPADGSLLNVWARQGEAIPYIRKRFPGIDLENAEASTKMISQAREAFPGERFRQTDLLSLDYPDGRFNAVLSLETLEHSPSPQRFVREMFRVLKPGGQLVLTCPAAAIEFHLWVADRFFDNHGEGPHRFPSTRRVKSMLRNAGFTVVHHRATLFIPEELTVIRRLNPLFEKCFQWFPASELGIRQLYDARKPANDGGARLSG
jgi:SAM-dependent methyltransferase